MMRSFFAFCLASLVLAVSSTAIDNQSPQVVVVPDGGDDFSHYGEKDCFSPCSCDGFGCFDDNDSFPRVVAVNPYNNNGKWLRTVKNKGPNPIVIVKDSRNECCCVKHHQKYDDDYNDDSEWGNYDD